MGLMHFVALPWLSGIQFFWMVQHILFFLTVGVPSLAWLYCLDAAKVLDNLPLLEEKKKQKSVVVVGNGPSLINGAKAGHLIDKADDVIRFNTFKQDPVEFTGTKCTYHVLGTCKVLPEATSGKAYVLPLVNATLTHRVYVVFENLRRVDALKASLVSGNVHLIREDATQSLIRELGLPPGQIPTSGFSLIGWAVRCFTDVQIVGFDFFTQGFHYYKEPIFVDLQQQMERCFTHSPHIEKELAYKWIEDKKLKYLADKGKK
jgi:hypothetical protein